MAVLPFSYGYRILDRSMDRNPEHLTVPPLEYLMVRFRAPRLARGGP